jgi:hypothetical protein
MTRCRPSLPRGPLGRFPRFPAPTAALRLPDAHRLALRCLRTPPTARGHPPARGDPGTSQVPGQPLCARHALRPRWSRCAGPFGPCHATGAAVSPPPQLTASASTTSRISGLYPVAPRTRCLRFAATVARVLPTAAQDSLPAGRSAVPVGTLTRGLLREVSVLFPTSLPPHPGFSWRTSRSAADVPRGGVGAGPPRRLPSGKRRAPCLLEGVGWHPLAARARRCPPDPLATPAA